MSLYSFFRITQSGCIAIHRIYSLTCIAILGLVKLLVEVKIKHGSSLDKA